MKTFYSWNDLKPYGINLLTGESCAYGLRLLCDLNLQGSILIQKYFGLASIDSLADNWNPGWDDQKAIKSVMLSKTDFKTIATFAAFNQDKSFAVIYNYAESAPVIAVESNEELHEVVEMWNKYHKPTKGESLTVILNHSFTQTPGSSIEDRNIHSFSGRSN